ncbi:MAG: hypothetical protein GX758_00245 [Tenericutes bacterium]|nr:hypothetical protein [Mycoplasmatota bacterium]
MEDDIVYCSCMLKLLYLRKIKKYNSFVDRISNYSDIVEEGQLCLVSETIIDEGDIDFNGEWNSNFVVVEELYPIKYCPICGKKYFALTKKLYKK